MTPDQITDIIRRTLYIALQIASPLLIIAMVVGLGISLFQSVTQINEMTLTFVPKMLVFAVAVSLIFPWMLKVMIRYTREMLVYQWDNLITLTNYAN